MNHEVIKELTTHKEIVSAYPVMRQLRTHLDEESYLALVREAQEKESYKLFALYEHEKMVAVTGFMPMVTLYNGRFIWVCELVTADGQRSKGFGGKLLSFVHDWAKEHGFSKVSLSSGLQRLSAHKFYEENMQYEKVSYVYLKKI